MVKVYTYARRTYLFACISKLGAHSHHPYVLKRFQVQEPHIPAASLTDSTPLPPYTQDLPPILPEKIKTSENTPT